MPLRDERTWRIVAGSPESLDTEPLVISRYAARDYPLDIVNKRREKRRGWSWLSITALEASEPEDPKLSRPPLNRPWPQTQTNSFIIRESNRADDPGPMPDFLRRA
jgi:hypothetical protein